MKVQKYEIARVIDKLKSIVQKNDQFPALGGILVKDGYLIASNSEITMKVKLEASAGSYFIIPMKAFDLIKNLPDGEIDISATDKNVVMIKIGAIKNKYQSYPPEEFNFDITEDPEADGVELNGKKIMEAIGHVIYAAADGGANTQMTGIYFEGTDSGVSLAALDGHVVAVDSVKAEGAKDMKLIVPKATAKKLISMGVIDDVTLTYTKNSAVFKSDEYTIYTRLIEGKYFAYQKMFTEGEINTCASRTALIGAMTRAKMCTEEKQPAVFQIEDDVLNISIRDKLADYQEQVPLQETVCKSIRLGFDSRLVLETLKAFTCDNIALGFTSPRTPMIGAFISDLGAMVPTAAKFGLAAAAVTAAVVGIGVAVDNYNQKALNSNLEEHFGNIKLSAQEVQDIASGILDQKYLANVEVALNEVKNADKLREDAQKALESNDVLEFKSRVGIKLTTEEQEDYTSNIETFVKSKIEELESRTFAAHIHVQTYLGGTEEGQTLAQNIEKWATADYVELDGLSSQLSQKVSEALKDGIIDADEEGAISALQEKMNSITARWKESEAQAKWDWINQEYGSLNAADLESGSFTDLLGAMRDQRQSAKESVQADVEQWYSELNSMESAGRITSAQNKQYHEMTGWYVKGQEGNELSKSLQLGSNTLNSAYAEKIQSNRQSLAENTQFSIDSAQKQLESGDTSAMTSALMYGFNELGNGKTLGVTTDATQNALSTMYESMKPDVTQMQGLIDDYREAGKAVPQSLMDSFNDAIEVGAAAGDTSATWQNYANQIWKNGSDELKASLTDPSNPMYETVRSQLPPELAEAIDRAAAETTTDDVTLEGLKASVDGDVDIDKDAWTSKLNEALGDLGETQEVTADHVKIKVDQGDCLWEIGNALGIDWQTIAEQNGIESPYIIHPDQELTISMDTLTAEVDGDKAQAAIEQAMSALDAEGAEMSVTAEGVKVDLADVEVDSDTAAAQIEAALGMESGTLAANGIEVQAGASVTIPSELVTVDTSGMQSATEQAADETETEPIEQEASANVNVTNTTTDTSGMQAQAEEDAKGAVGDVPVEGSANVTFSGTTTDTSGVVEQVTADIESAVSDVPANGHASITLDQSNNAAEIYSLATADVVSAFSETIPADGHVDVTLDQTNNAAAIYSECAGQVQSTFSQGFTASADVAVTLNWHITNPSASISTSSSGSSVSATIAGHASGGEVGLNGAELSWVGEEGLEYIIPTVPARRQRGIELWKSAGRTLGVLGPDDEISAHASGGIVGKEVSNTIPYFDTDSSSQDSEKTEKETVPTNVVSDKSGVVVQVNLSPQFNISDTNDSDVIRLIKAHIKELADDLGSEIATMLSEAYENTPVTT